MSENINYNRAGSCVHIMLDRPVALNALNLEMVRTISRILDEVETDPHILSVILRGAGERAFCAGGDIKAAREMGLKAQKGEMSLDDVVQFFREEYALNKKLFHFKKPIISIMHGITMGGGVGLSAPCRYRVATETTQWAMPEVSIGFFPDVGAGYYLTRLPYHVGFYLGLSGESIKNKADLVKCKLATHAVPSAQIEDMVQDISTCKNETDVARALEHHSFAPLLPELPYKLIDEIFSKPALDDVMAKLALQADPWAKHVYDVILSKSPLSIAVTFAHLQAATHEEFDVIIARDLHLATEFMRGSDMFEGIRAMVVDKDRKPQWASQWGEAIPPHFTRLFHQGQKVA
jgi:enoyl-CoA hydratase